MDHYAVIGVSATGEYSKRVSDFGLACETASKAIEDERLTDVYIFHVEGLSAETAGRSDLSMKPVSWYYRDDGWVRTGEPDQSGPDTLAKAQDAAERVLDKFVAQVEQSNPFLQMLATLEVGKPNKYGIDTGSQELDAILANVLDAGQEVTIITAEGYTTYYPDGRVEVEKAEVADTISAEVVQEYSTLPGQVAIEVVEEE